MAGLADIYLKFGVLGGDSLDRETGSDLLSTINSLSRQIEQDRTAAKIRFTPMITPKTEEKFKALVSNLSETLKDEAKVKIKVDVGAYKNALNGVVSYTQSRLKVIKDLQISADEILNKYKNNDTQSSGNNSKASSQISEEAQKLSQQYRDIQVATKTFQSLLANVDKSFTESKDYKYGDNSKLEARKNDYIRILKSWIDEASKFDIAQLSAGQQNAFIQLSKNLKTVIDAASGKGDVYKYNSAAFQAIIEATAKIQEGATVADDAVLKALASTRQLFDSSDNISAENINKISKLLVSITSLKSGAKNADVINTEDKLRNILSLISDISDFSQLSPTAIKDVEVLRGALNGLFSGRITNNYDIFTEIIDKAPEVVNAIESVEEAISEESSQNVNPISVSGLLTNEQIDTAINIVKGLKKQLDDIFAEQPIQVDLDTSLAIKKINDIKDKLEELTKSLNEVEAQSEQAAKSASKKEAPAPNNNNGKGKSNSKSTNNTTETKPVNLLEDQINQAANIITAFNDVKKEISSILGSEIEIVIKSEDAISKLKDFVEKFNSIIGEIKSNIDLNLNNVANITSDDKSKTSESTKSKATNISEEKIKRLESEVSAFNTAKRELLSVVDDGIITLTVESEDAIVELRNFVNTFNSIIGEVQSNIDLNLNNTTDTTSDDKSKTSGSSKSKTKKTKATKDTSKIDEAKQEYSAISEEIDKLSTTINSSLVKSINETIASANSLQTLAQNIITTIDKIKPISLKLNGFTDKQANAFISKAKNIITQAGKVSAQYTKLAKSIATLSDSLGNKLETTIPINFKANTSEIEDQFRKATYVMEDAIEDLKTRFSSISVPVPSINVIPEPVKDESNSAEGLTKEEASELNKLREPIKLSFDTESALEQIKEFISEISNELENLKNIKIAFDKDALSQAKSDAKDITKNITVVVSDTSDTQSGSTTTKTKKSKSPSSETKSTTTSSGTAQVSDELDTKYPLVKRDLDAVRMRSLSFVQYISAVQKDMQDKANKLAFIERIAETSNKFNKVSPSTFNDVTFLTPEFFEAVNQLKNGNYTVSTFLTPEFFNDVEELKSIMDETSTIDVDTEDAQNQIIKLEQSINKVRDDVESIFKAIEDKSARKSKTNSDTQYTSDENEDSEFKSVESEHRKALDQLGRYRLMSRTFIRDLEGELTTLVSQIEDLESKVVYTYKTSKRDVGDPITGETVYTEYDTTHYATASELVKYTNKATKEIDKIEKSLQGISISSEIQDQIESIRDSILELDEVVKSNLEIDEFPQSALYISDIDDALNQLRNNIEKFKTDNKYVEELESNLYKLSQIKINVQNLSSEKNEHLINSLGLGDNFNQLKDDIDLLEQFQLAIENFRTGKTDDFSFWRTSAIDENNVVEINNVSQAIGYYNQLLDKVVQSNSNVSKAVSKANAGFRSQQGSVISLNKIYIQAREYFDKYQVGIKNNVKLMSDWQNYLSELYSGKYSGNPSDAENIMLKLQVSTKNAGAEVESLSSKLNKLFSERFLSQAYTRITTLLVNQLHNIYANIVNIDTAMVELKKVTDETDTVYKNFMSTASSTAKAVGSTIADTISATADFARLGYSINEAAQLSEAALIYTNVGDGIQDVATASSAIISAMKAYKIEAEDAITIVDRLNVVGNKFAISSGDAGVALQKSAAQLSAAGNTIEESLGLIVAANDVVQDADVVGTMLKTISMRIRGAKTELEDAGLETDGMAESTAKLRKEIKALSGVDIMINDDTFKSTYDIIEELSEKWQDLTDIQQASITELLAGKRGGSVMSSLLTNFEDAQNVITETTNSTNSALEENAKYLDSINGKIQNLKRSYEELSQGTLDSGLIKTGISFLTQVIDVLNEANKALPGFTNSLIGVAGAISVLQRSGINALFSTAVNAKGKKTLRFGAGGILSNNSNSIFGQKYSTAINTIKNDEQALINFYNTYNQTLNGSVATTENLNNAINAAFKYGGALSNASLEVRNFASNITNYNRTLGTNAITVNELSAEYRKWAEDTRKQATALAKLQNIGMELLAGVANIAISMLVSVAITALIKWVDEISRASEIAAEKITELEEALKSTQSEIEKVNEQLDENKKKIDEINANPLKNTDDNNLKSLKLENDQLEARLTLLKQIEYQQKKDVYRATETKARDTAVSNVTVNSADNYTGKRRLQLSDGTWITIGTDAEAKAKYGFGDNNVKDYLVSNTLGGAIFGVDSQTGTGINESGLAYILQGEIRSLREKIAANNLKTDEDIAQYNKDMETLSSYQKEYSNLLNTFMSYISSGEINPESELYTILNEFIDNATSEDLLSVPVSLQFQVVDENGKPLTNTAMSTWINNHVKNQDALSRVTVSSKYEIENESTAQNGDTYYKLKYKTVPDGDEKDVEIYNNDQKLYAEALATQFNLTYKDTINTVEEWEAYKKELLQYLKEQNSEAWSDAFEGEVNSFIDKQLENAPYDVQMQVLKKRAQELLKQGLTPKDEELASIIQRENELTAATEKAVSSILNSYDSGEASAWNGFDTIIEGIETVEGKLSSFYQTLSSGNKLTKDQINSLLKEFPELGQYINNDKQLMIEIEKLFNQSKSENSKTISEQLSGLAEYAQTVQSLYDNGSITEDEYKNYQSIINAQRNVLFYQKKYIDNWTLAEESVTSFADKVKSNSDKLSLLNTAISEMNDNGEISADTYAKLVEENEKYAAAIDIVDGKFILQVDKLKELQVEEYKAELATIHLARSFLLQSAATIRSNDDYSEFISKLKELAAEEARVQGIIDKTENANGNNTDTDTTPAWKKAFDEEYAKRQHLIAMGKQTEAEFYEWLNKQNEDYFAKSADYQDEYRKYQEEYFNWYNGEITNAADKAKEAANSSLDNKDFEGAIEQFTNARQIIDDRIKELIKSGVKPESSVITNLQKEVDELDKTIVDTQNDYIDFLNDAGETEANNLIEKSGDYASAIDEYLTIAERSRNRANELVTSGEYDWDSEKVQSFVKAAENADKKVIELNGDIKDIAVSDLTESAKKLLEEKDFDGAVNAYKSAIKTTEDYITYLIQQGYDENSETIKNLRKDIQGLEDDIDDAENSRVENEKSFWEQQKKAIEDKYDKEIEALEKIQDEQEKINKAEQLRNDLIEARQKLEDARKNKSQLIFADGGFKYDVNQEDVLSAANGVADAEKAISDQMLQDQIDLLKEQKQAEEDYYDTIIGKINDYINKTSDILSDTDLIEKILESEYGDVIDEPTEERAIEESRANSKETQTQSPESKIIQAIANGTFNSPLSAVSDLITTALTSESAISRGLTNSGSDIASRIQSIVSGATSLVNIGNASTSVGDINIYTSATTSESILKDVAAQLKATIPSIINNKAYSK